MTEREVAVGHLYELNDREALYVALKCLRPLKELHTGLLQQARLAGMLLGNHEELSVRFPVSQLKLLAEIVEELEDGLRNGWSQTHTILLEIAQKQARQTKAQTSMQGQDSQELPSHSDLRDPKPDQSKSS